MFFPTGYGAVKNTVGFLDLSERGKVRVTGPDRIPFLHAMISNDVERLEMFSGRYGTFLTATGKIIADFWYYRLEECVLLDLPPGTADYFVPKLNEFIIMEEVELTDVSAEYGHLSVQGPVSGHLLRSLFGEELPQRESQIAVYEWEGEKILLIAKSTLSNSGFEIIVPRSVARDFSIQLRRAGESLDLQEVSSEAFDVLRLENCIALFGIDFSDRNNPLEAGLQNAYSLEKGCYPGQEVVAKATNIGGVARLLIPLRLIGELVPEKADKVFDETGTEIGWVTSGAYSPDLGHGIALAYLKRRFAEAGLKVLVEDTRGRRLEAETVSGFMS